ncbi:MAG TPA: hypothetical protein VKB02_11245 [Pyrinomonadaceae bacterium]|nr:hypothetical protein [Pyrinomonadaceae bacterium]
MPRPACHYLLLAAAIHVALTATIFLIGNFRLLPNTFDSNGIGLTFALDGTSYQPVATDLAEELHSNGFIAWLNAKAPLHSRLHSLSFATFGKLLGHNILAAEPLNLFYYLAILICVYLLGREVFNVKTGVLAATIVGLWPTFLFHSTQLLRDPLSILCLLALMLVLVLVLGRELSWRNGIALGIAGGLLATLFWLARGNMWNVVLVAITITLVMLGFRMMREKRFMTGNAAVMLLIVAAALLVPTRLESTTLPGVRPPLTPLAIPTASQPAAREGVWNMAIKQISTRRAGFRFYNAHASDIDPDVQFSNVGDIVRFIPRALVIGFFAPFPKMWVEAGSFGFATRIVSGLETLAMYLLYVAVGVCVWKERRNRKMWLLFLVATIGMLALGLVVVNAGALFRLRYVFWMLTIIIGSRGLHEFTSRSVSQIRRNPEYRPRSYQTMP